MEVNTDATKLVHLNFMSFGLKSRLKGGPMHLGVNQTPKTCSYCEFPLSLLSSMNYDHL